MTDLNRLHSLKAQLNNRQKKAGNTDRKARTRTLIQMGGMLNMLGLPQLCGINDGEDLQQDLESKDKAATLLGLLVHLNETLAVAPLVLDPCALEQFKQRGIRMMKDHETQKLRAVSAQKNEQNLSGFGFRSRSGS
jgi:hypothetical protein